MHIISAADFTLFKFCSKMTYSAGRKLASKIVAWNSSDFLESFSPFNNVVTEGINDSK